MSARPRVEAAVLVPVIDAADPAERMIVLVRRAPGGAHGGQLAFPGGKREACDATLLDTALRESREEIGLTAEAIASVEPLTALHTFTTRFHVHPFLARIERPSSWVVDPREVVEVIETTLGDLSAAPRRTMRIDVPGYPEGRLFPYIPLGAHRLWGATLRILEPLVPRLLAVGGLDQRKGG